jgi:S1-C subfamily serine protease
VRGLWDRVGGVSTTRHPIVRFVIHARAVQLIAWVVLFWSWLIGCAAQAPSTKLSESASRDLRQNMKIYTPAQLDEGSVDRLGPVSAISCKSSPWDSASEQDAVDQLLQKASQAGGTGIADLSCQHWGSNNFENTCWSSYTCTAAIIRASRPPPTVSGSTASSSSGTGFVISAEGHILTSSHLVSGAKSMNVAFNGETLPASVVRDDSQNDLAIIKIDRRSTPLEFRDDGRVRVGDAVMIIGFPLKVTTGNVTALSGIKDDVRFMQVSALVEPGNTGSPVFDENGRVIGIALGTGSVIKASIAKTLMDANGINFVVSQHADRKSVSDVTDVARNAIVFIESR